ncbi:tyrosine-type recombinase/integrase [Duganella sp. CY15W]|uniref:site-specific integrase n=1 Tax=Duganella sp. CY15W TaxID=2692172 RepID=UPI001370C491|nr:site-specific integrase [Duganella sp. CY15W]MYM30625.1 tyrosine-type recombinase/integrase [Duganella sp. CY15W]
MATIENRSRFVVSVKNKDEYYREFPFTNRDAADEYCAWLETEKGYKAKLKQKEDSFFVRIRQTGYPLFQKTFKSLEDADTAIARIEAERKSGVFIDYTKAHNVTFEHLLKRYIEEEGPKHKGWEKSQKYKFKGWLADLEGQTTKGVKEKDGSDKPRQAVMRVPSSEIQWMRKPFTAIETEDIEGYIDERLEVVEPATVDREIDCLRAVFTVATKVWKYRLVENPMEAVRRPKYFNERDRRLKQDEHQRLLDSAFEEDKKRSVDLRVEELMALDREAAQHLPTKYKKKLLVKAALEQCRKVAEQNYIHIPLFETFVNFQIMTAARRGEALQLNWADVDFEKRSAYIAETKNGQPRSLPLRGDLVEQLKELPQCEGGVFPITAAHLRKAWDRILERAKITDLRIHDLRHEGISQVAETAKFSLIDLQKFSGHRDVRMLLRYAHLCTTHMAHKLDEAFSSEISVTVHRGRKRLKLAEVARISQAEASSSNVIPLFGKDAA